MTYGKIVTAIPGPKSKDLAERLKSCEASGVTYISDRFPLFWKSATGLSVTDVDENVFLDFTSAFGVATFGHSNPNIVTAIKAQAEKLPHGMGDVHPPEIKVRLLERLSALFPGGGGRSILCSSGGEAVEAALKTARLKSGKSGVIAFTGGYHGLSYGTLAVSGIHKFVTPWKNQLSPFTRLCRFPKQKDSIEEHLSEIDSLFEESKSSGHPIGAILFEPIQGRAGVRIPPAGWTKAVVDWARSRNVVSIADEIMTGMGRTGKMFAVDHDKTSPDILCLGKALTGSLPFSACIGSEKIMTAWPRSEGEALHTSTFLGHPLGCAAALAVLDELERKDWLQITAEMGGLFLEKARAIAREMDLICEVRGKGMMIGIELSRNNQNGLAFEVTQIALQKGLILLPSGENGNTISFNPSFTISNDEVDWGMRILRESLLEMA